MPVSNTQNPFTMAQIKADMMMAKYAIEQAETLSAKLSKTIKGQAGYHIQQACEKMIKIQLYSSGKKLDNARIYKHSIQELLTYANSLKITVLIPSYIEKNKNVITRWEAEGRYDTHLVVRLDTLKKHYEEIEQWYEDLRQVGFK